MAGNKSILNSTALDCARELLKWNFAVPYSFQNLGAALSVRSVSATMSEIELTPNPLIPDSARPITQVFKLPLAKYDFGSRVPRDLSYEGLYPCTVAQFNQYMSGGFDFIVEPGDLEFRLNGQWVVFDETRTMDAVPDAASQIQLRTSIHSKRFVAGAEFALYVLRSDTTTWTPLEVSGQAPDAGLGEPYTFGYSISGGVPPYRVELVSGTLPANISHEGVFSGLTTRAGMLSWVLQVFDSVGAMRQISDSVRIETQPLELVSSPGTAYLGVAFDESFVIQGGLQPYRYRIHEGGVLTGLSLSNEGRLSGVPNALNAEALIQVEDSSGQMLEFVFSQETETRTVAQITTSLLGKLREWFEFEPDHTYTSGDAILGRVSNTPATLVSEFPVMTETAPGRVYATINLPDCYLELTGFDFGSEQGVFFYYHRNSSIATTETLVSQRDLTRGWDFSLTSDRRVRSRLTINSQPYNTVSEGELTAVGPAILGLLRTRNRLSHWSESSRLLLETSNNPVEVRTDLSTDPLSNAAVPLRIGRGHPVVGAEAPRMRLGSVWFVDEPLLVDEIEYLSNEGQGRLFDEIVADSGV